MPASLFAKCVEKKGSVFGVIKDMAVFFDVATDGKADYRKMMLEKAMLVRRLWQEEKL